MGVQILPVCSLKVHYVLFTVFTYQVLIVLLYHKMVMDEVTGKNMYFFFSDGDYYTTTYA